VDIALGPQISSAHKIGMINAYYAVRLDVGGVVKLHTLCILEYSALGRRKDLVLGLRGRNRNQTEDAR